MHYLSLVFNEASWKERALKMAVSINGVVIKYPTSFGMWACVIYDIFKGFNEIAVVGERCKDIVSEIVSRYLPNKIIQSAPGDHPGFPLLADRYVKDKTNVYLCRNYSCLQPVERVAELMQLIDQERKR